MATIETRCCIAGGGPAGMMLGVLLARAGIPVVVLEKHADFLRDFRGDTVHPSTLEVMHELGLLDEFLARPALRAAPGAGHDRRPARDHRGLHAPARARAVHRDGAAMGFPRFSGAVWPPLSNIRADHAGRSVRADRAGRAHRGVRVAMPEGAVDIHADLVVGADGRTSTVRDLARLPLKEIGAPIDVLWMRLPQTRRATIGWRHLATSGMAASLYAGSGRLLAVRIRHFEGRRTTALRQRGFDAFRASIADVVPFLARPWIDAIASWNDVKLLTVRIDRLRQWHRPGLLCIGDAAHAMSPIGGVGINLAIQDAVAAANLLYGPLRRGVPTAAELQAVQRRRELPTRITQRMQVILQNSVLVPALQARVP